MANILFIGLGNMGSPIAGHLANAGHTMTVHNRSTRKTEQWLSTFAGQPLNPAQVPNDLDAVILCVSRDEDVREWLIDNGIISKLNPGTIIIDHSTTSARLAEEMSDAATQQGCFYCDIPVSGGQQGAQSGQLTLMAGCPASEFERIVSLCNPYTKSIQRMGEAGTGQKTKMVNQICVAGLIQGLAEGVKFAQANGLDIGQVMSLLSQGAGGSWQMANRHKTMAEGQYDHGFAVSLMHKDLQICLNEARALNLTLPVTEVIDGYYAELERDGHGQKDTSALLLRL